MITAVDTSVLLDVFAADLQFGPGSRAALHRCIREGGLMACEIVWAEVAAAFSSQEAATAAMGRLGVGFGAVDENIALAAGVTWGSYRQRGGKRDRIIPDFVIGAHAQQQADRLLTRDRGFYRTYFERLLVLDPTSE